MGLFNEVTVECPECGEIHIHQSKAGSCSLSNSSINDAEPEDQRDLINEIEDGLWCQHCSYQFSAAVRVVTRKDVVVY